MKKYKKKSIFEGIGNFKLHLVRVPYGKKDTPVELREYKIREMPTSAIGTVSEIKDWLKKNNIPADLEVIG